MVKRTDSALLLRRWFDVKFARADIATEIFRGAVPDRPRNPYVCTPSRKAVRCCTRLLTGAVVASAFLPAGRPVHFRKWLLKLGYPDSSAELDLADFGWRLALTQRALISVIIFIFLFIPHSDQPTIRSDLDLDLLFP